MRDTQGVSFIQLLIKLQLTTEKVNAFGYLSSLIYSSSMHGHIRYFVHHCQFAPMI